MEFIQGNDSKIYHIIQANDNKEQNTQPKVSKRYIAIIEHKKTTSNILYMSSFHEISRKNRKNFAVQLRNINVLDEVLYDMFKDYSCFIDFEVINKNISYGMSKLYLKTNFNVAKKDIIDNNNFTFNYGNICEFENTLKMKNDTIDIEYYTFDYKKPAKDNLDNTEIDYIHNFSKLEKYDLKDYIKLLIYITIKSEQDISQKYILICTKYSIFVEELTTDIIAKFLKLENLCSELATVNPKAPDIVKHLKIYNIFNNFNHIEMYDFIFKFDNVVQKLKIQLIDEILNVENQDTTYFNSFIEKCNKEERELFDSLRKSKTKNEIIYNHPHLDEFFTRANNDKNINSIMLHLRIISSEISNILRESDDISDTNDNKNIVNMKSDYENTKRELQKFGQNEFGENKIIILEHKKNKINKISDIVESIKKFYENENNDMMTEIMNEYNSRL
ncbi:hypothetical protein BDAP_002424 [Binucleata daphniae]